MTYKLEKRLWTHVDFDQMGWHDCRIYRIRLTKDLEMDIDYILKWNQPDVEGLPFTFWVAPATLVFKDIKELTFDLGTAVEKPIEIEGIERTEPDSSYKWNISTQQGDIDFCSEEYEQFIRQDPFFEFGQTISSTERYGFSLERTTNQENPNRIRPDILDHRKQDSDLYEIVKKRQLKRIESDELIKAREKNEIDLKQYIITKRQLKETLDHFDLALKGTKFEQW